MDLRETEYNNLQPGGKRSLRQTSCRCEDIIRIDSEVKNESMSGNYLAQGRDQWWYLMNVVMNF